MKKILVLGALGMAGHIIVKYLNLQNKYKIYALAKSNKGQYINKILDVRNFDHLENYIKTLNPDYVINCIGILVSKSNDELTTAIQLNSYLPQYLSKLGKVLAFKLIHISTDCVFSGKEGEYVESAFRDGDTNYARTKALGEIVNNRDLTIRTSIIGPELKTNGTGLLDWFFKQNEDIEGYSKVYWSGVTTLELAKQIDAFIEQDIRGLYHLCPKEKISKYELLLMCNRIWEKSLYINNNSTYKMDKSLVCTRKDFLYVNKRPEYNEMLEELKLWMDRYSTFYSHYNLKRKN